MKQIEDEPPDSFCQENKLSPIAIEFAHRTLRNIVADKLCLDAIAEEIKREPVQLRKYFSYAPKENGKLRKFTTAMAVDLQAAKRLLTRLDYDYYYESIGTDVETFSSRVVQPMYSKYYEKVNYSYFPDDSPQPLIGDFSI